MENKCLYFGKKSEDSLKGRKINFRALDQEEEEEDPNPKSFYKSADRRRSDLSASLKQIE